MSRSRCLPGIAACAFAVLLVQSSSRVAASVDIAGRIVDRDSGNPIAGAAIEARESSVGEILSTATSDRRGRYVLSLPERVKALIVVTFESGAYAAFHGLFDPDMSQSFERRIALSRLTNDEAAWLQRVNLDREAMHLGVVTMDEAALLSARLHAGDMAIRSYFDHADRFGRQPWQRFSSLHGIGGDYENIGRGENATWRDIENAFVAEGPPKQRGLCTHFTTLFDPRAVWVGLAVVQQGRAAGARLSKTYFDQELIEYPY